MEEEDMITTCRDIAHAFGIDYLQASSLVKLLLSQNIAEEVDTVKSGKRGRPTVKYRLPDMVSINFKTGKCTIH